MHADARTWFAERTWQSPSWTVEELLAAKGSRTVSVVLPALNEEATVADVIASVRPLLGSLVDELVVVDSGSTDRTVEVSRAAGARVVRRADVLPELAPVPGKGEVLWRSLAATSVAAMAGARVFRAHEVARTRKVVEMVASIRGTRTPARCLRALA